MDGFSGLGKAGQVPAVRPQLIQANEHFHLVLFVALLQNLSPLVQVGQQTSFALAGTIWDIAATVAVIWLILPVLAWFDPFYTEKVDALKGIAGILPIPGKPK